MRTSQPSDPASSATARNDDARVVESLIAAAEYARVAMDGLIRQAGEDDTQLRRLFYDYVNLVHTLEVTFLFPNLASHERDLMVALMGARNAFLVGLKVLRHWKVEEQRKEDQAGLRDMRRRFVQLRSQVLAAHLQERLSRVQHRLLEQEFLAVPVLPAGQTGFFHRADVEDSAKPEWN
jgi:hypothetical protein